MSKDKIINEMYMAIVENGHTPYILVNVNQQTKVPMAYVKDGKIVLNISMTACQNLYISEHAITFGARFGGKHFDIHVPLFNVQAIYARETGEGIMFDIPEFVPSDLQMAMAAEQLLDAITNQEQKQEKVNEEQPKRPALRLVK